MKVNPFTQKLLKWYSLNKRDLPWRRTTDPYKIWISEIMLQQTTVAAVIPYYERWIKRFPTVDSVSKAREKTILNMWQGLGYYSRAKNILKSSKIIVNEYGGAIPKDPKILKQLPGFGSYTVGAVLSIAHDLPLTIIDANVRRVIMRINNIEGIANTTQDAKINSILKELLPNKSVGDFNQALMELGATLCRAKNPLCAQCPVKSLCQAFKLGKQEVIPQTQSKKIIEIDAAIGVITNDDKFLIQKRPSKGLLANLWEFPGGKIKEGESPILALKREIQEEVRIEITNIKSLMKTVHYYTQFKVNLHVYTCQPKALPILKKSQKWVNLDQFRLNPMPSGSVKIVDKLLQSDYT